MMALMILVAAEETPIGDFAFGEGLMQRDMSAGSALRRAGRRLRSIADLRVIGHPGNLQPQIVAQFGQFGGHVEFLWWRAATD